MRHCGPIVAGTLGSGDLSRQKVRDRKFSSNYAHSGPKRKDKVPASEVAAQMRKWRR